MNTSVTNEEFSDDFITFETPKFIFFWSSRDPRKGAPASLHCNSANDYSTLSEFSVTHYSPPGNSVRRPDPQLTQHKLTSHISHLDLSHLATASGLDVRTRQPLIPLPRAWHSSLSGLVLRLPSTAM